MGQASSSETGGGIMASDSTIHIHDLPNEILQEIFIQLPPLELIRHITRVCSRWHTILRNQGLWLDLCRRSMGIHLTPDMRVSLRELQNLCLKKPFKRNFISNGNAKEKLEHWKVTSNRDMFVQEGAAPAGSNPLSSIENGGMDLQHCWATSYGWCIKHQVIDLKKEGCFHTFMDKVHPVINVSEWVAARYDCASEYYMEITLLNDKKQKVAQSVRKEISFDQWQGRAWHQVCATIDDYKSGLRYIKFEHGGKDRQFWAGNYGTKFTGARLELTLQKQNENHT